MTDHTHNPDRRPKTSPDFLPPWEDPTGAVQPKPLARTPHADQMDPADLFLPAPANPIPDWLLPAHKHRLPVYTEATWRQIIDRIMTGETVRQICRDPTMPDILVLMRYLKANPEKKAEMDEAKRISTETAYEAELLDTSRAKDENGEDTLEDSSRSSLRVAALKFIMRAWNPDRYGEKKNEGVSVNINLQAAMADGEARVGRVFENE